MSLKDFEQDQRLTKIENEKYIGRMESRILRRIVGEECTIRIDFENLRCKITDVDELFVMLEVYDKKKVSTVIRRVAEIHSITLDKEHI